MSCTSASSSSGLSSCISAILKAICLFCLTYPIKGLLSIAMEKVAEKFDKKETIFMPGASFTDACQNVADKLGVSVEEVIDAAKIFFVAKRQKSTKERLFMGNIEENGNWEMHGSSAGCFAEIIYGGAEVHGHRRISLFRVRLDPVRALKSAAHNRLLTAMNEQLQRDILDISGNWETRNVVTFAKLV